MTITESIKFDKLKEENEKLKKELTEKDKEIELMNEQCDGAIREILEQQLYKEDFQKVTCLWEHSSICCDNGITFYLKDNSLYDNLPSKEDK